MATLYDHYNPETPAQMPMNRIYQAREGELAGKIVQFRGVSANSGGGSFTLWLSDPFTRTLVDLQVGREDLRDYEFVPPTNFSPELEIIVDDQARQYARTRVAFQGFLQRNPYEIVE